MAAGFVAGLLVAGLGGRLVMRVLAATSGDDAQGLLTEAEETVGEITLGGTIGFVIFVGLLIPLFSSLVFLALRRVLPQSAWIAGLVFGIVLLGTFGVDDPLSPENIDFAILTPRWLAVALVTATALLFGMTFTAIAAQFDATVPALFDKESGASFRHKVPYVSLIWLLIPFFLVPALVYVALRTVFQGRAAALLDRDPIRRVGQAAIGVVGLLALGLVVEAGAEII